MKTVAFHINQLGLRGTEIAAFDYAHFNETLLGNKSIIISKRNHASSHPEGEKKFRSRFDVFLYDDISEIDSILLGANADVFYALKAGHYDGIVSSKIKSAMHVVFKNYEPHGDVYAYVSEWLSIRMSQGKNPFVPHMVYMPDNNQNMRHSLNIPAHNIVYGRYGGFDSFDIDFVSQTVYEVAKKNPNIYFIFMNTDNFLANKLYQKNWKNRFIKPILYPTTEMPNVKFLSGTSDMLEKRKFINTCDAMLHASIHGETFGLSCGEFSVCNKPVITCNNDKITVRSHIEMLGDKGVYYSDKKTLSSILENFPIDKSKNWDAYSELYNPEVVMDKFNTVFLK